MLSTAFWFPNPVLATSQYKQSPEVASLEVRNIYLELLGREPNKAEFDFCTSIATRKGSETVRSGIIESDEYQAKLKTQKEIAKIDKKSRGRLLKNRLYYLIFGYTKI